MLTLRKTHGYLGWVRVVEHRLLVLVYRVEKSVQSSLLSSLVLTQYKILILNLL